MCKLLDTNKELSHWNERTFPISLEVILQVHSTCLLNVQEIEDDFLSVTTQKCNKFPSRSHYLQTVHENQPVIIS